MTPVSPARAALYSIPVIALFFIGTMIAFTDPAWRFKAIGIVLSVTVLTFSSLIAYVLLHAFAGRMLEAGRSGRSRWLSFILTIIAVGAGVGSTFLMKFVLQRMG